ncbi:MAG TPA: CHAD domain-containing protein [Ramlibacter sp.]|nr:CHAD domain-containing protein [Ramlibacter sp.]
MTEFELKLEIPPERLQAVLTAMRQEKVRSQRLQARYFDTRDQALARHGIVLRLRKEGRVWVQTAKVAGSAALERLEHNAPLGPSSGSATPAVSLARHAGTPVGEKIRQALDLESLDRPMQLVPWFETDVLRLTRRIDIAGSVVEVALDRGKIHAGNDWAALCEVEFELIEGERVAAVQLAREWGAAHGLWLSVISKSAKGRRLAAGQASGPPVGAAPVNLSRSASGTEIAAAVVQACLEQVLGNASEAGAGTAGAEHVHQLRVGIRRLRTALREMRGLATETDPAWEAALVDTFRALGRHRDHYQLASMQPQLEAQGAPALDVELPDDPAPDPAAVVRSPAFQDTLLGLLVFAHSAADGRGGSVHHGKALKLLKSRLDKLHDQVGKDGRRFLRLEPTRQHRVRKRLKRLRYLAEFVARFFSARKGRAFITALKPAQDALGLYNDELTALEAYRRLAAREPAAWFGVGWLSARRAPLAAQCQRELERFAMVKPFWN